MMSAKDMSYILLKSLYEERSIAEHQIKSYNAFIDVSLPEVIKIFGRVEPRGIKTSVSEVRIEFTSIEVDKPKVREFRGMVRAIYPMEARLRGLTYEAPLYANVRIVEDGSVVEEGKVYIGSIPVMVKSKICRLHGLSEEELVKLGEDPLNPGGYFIINGNERVIVTVEDLMPNRIFLQKTDDPKFPYAAKLFSERGYGQYRVLHVIEKSHEGVVYISFGRFQRIPVILLLKALGIDRDDVLYEIISEGDDSLSTDLYVNFLELSECKVKDRPVTTTEDALEYLGRLAGATTTRRAIRRGMQVIDLNLLSHMGHKPEHRLSKLLVLAKIVRKLLYFSYGKDYEDDVDHLGCKKMRASGEMMAILFRSAFITFLNDVRENYERLIRKNKTPTLKAIIKPDVLRTRIISAMATGTWPGDRTGVCQFMDRTNFYSVTSYLHRVKSTLEEKRENFEARDLHGTHWGRLCVAETPDSMNIGLRKNLALGAEITPAIDFNEEEFISLLESWNLFVSYKREVENLKKKYENEGE